jgi:hypothetical protein
MAAYYPLHCALVLGQCGEAFMNFRMRFSTHWLRFRKSCACLFSFEIKATNSFKIFKTILTCFPKLWHTVQFGMVNDSDIFVEYLSSLAFPSMEIYV